MVQVSAQITLDAGFIEGSLQGSLGFTSGEEFCTNGGCTFTVGPCQWSTGEQYVNVETGKVVEIAHSWRWYHRMQLTDQAGCSCNVLNNACSAAGVSRASGSHGVSQYCGTLQNGVCSPGGCGP